MKNDNFPYQLARQLIVASPIHYLEGGGKLPLDMLPSCLNTETVCGRCHVVILLHGQISEWPSDFYNVVFLSARTNCSNI